MKKTTAYILSVVLILSLASGCGRMENTAPQTTPKTTATPAAPTPDVNNGIVNDGDGIIEPDDNGRIPEATHSASASPNAEQMPEGDVASASPSPDSMDKNK